MRGSKFKSQSSPVRHPKPLNGSQRVLSDCAYVWLRTPGYDVSTGLPRTRRDAGVTPAPEVKTTCKHCSSLVINGTCTLTERHTQ